MELCVYPLSTSRCRNLRLLSGCITFDTPRIRKYLTLVGYSGNPEPVTEKTLKNSTEFFTKHDGLAWHGPCVGNGAGREKF